MPRAVLTKTGHGIKASHRIFMLANQHSDGTCGRCAHRVLSLCTQGVVAVHTGCCRCVHRVLLLCTQGVVVVYTGCCCCAHGVLLLCTQGVVAVHTGCARSCVPRSVLSATRAHWCWRQLELSVRVNAQSVVTGRSEHSVCCDRYK